MPAIKSVTTAASLFARAAGLFARAATDRRVLTHLIGSLKSYDRVQPAECPCCGFVGKFSSFGLTARPGAACPKCGSTERHRLLTLASVAGFFDVRGRRVLHFAAEKSMARMIRKLSPAEYRTADLNPLKGDMVLNIEHIDLPGSSQDVVIASHVLEHVDDAKALAELYRILTPGGRLIAMIPIVEGWPQTYEDPSITSPAERERHFGQWDHIRYFGADFRDRVKAAGFVVDEFTAGGAESARYRLTRGQKVFRATKPA